MLTIKQVDDTIKTIFNDKQVLSVDSVYEKNGQNYKLVISIHGLELPDSMIIHTKFIFNVNDEKSGLIDNKLTYLYGLGCDYVMTDFINDDVNSLHDVIYNIINEYKFSTDLTDLSDFLYLAPDAHINNYLHQKKVDMISCYNVQYSPKFKISPCTETTYTFNINISDIYDVDVNISMIRNADTNNKYKLTCTYNEHITDVELDSMSNIGYVIGQELINVFNDAKILN